MIWKDTNYARCRAKLVINQKRQQLVGIAQTVGITQKRPFLELSQSLTVNIHTHNNYYTFNIGIHQIPTTQSSQACFST